MQKHIKALEGRRDYLKDKVANLHPTQEAFREVFQGELDALNWALDRLEADPEIDIFTGEILSGDGKPVEPAEPEYAWHPYGPIRVGETVKALAPVLYAGIHAGELGTVTDWDSWPGEEYPYIVTFEGGRKAAFERGDLLRRGERK